MRPYQGTSQVVSAAGQYNLATSAAAINAAAARHDELRDDVQGVETFWQMPGHRPRRTRGRARPRLTAEELALVARAAAPRPLTVEQIDRVSGELRWPGPLLDPDFEERAWLSTNARPAGPSTALDYNDQSQVRENVHSLFAGLKAQDQCNPTPGLRGQPVFPAEPAVRHYPYYLLTKDDTVHDHGVVAAMAAACCLAAAAAQGDIPGPAMDNAPYKNAELAVEQRVEDLLGRMTLEEKIDQLHQSLAGDVNPNNIGKTPERFQPTYGSWLFNEGTLSLRNALQREAVEKSRLGIPAIFGADVIHGYRTIFPIPLGSACSWNPHLLGQSCHMAAVEAWHNGVDWTFAPMIDIAIDPRWGRIAEGFGESPYAASVYCAAAVRGFQGTHLAGSGSIAACLKHFVGYGAAEGGRDYSYTDISPQRLWELYLPPYEAGVRAGLDGNERIQRPRRHTDDGESLSADGRAPCEVGISWVRRIRLVRRRAIDTPGVRRR